MQIVSEKKKGYYRVLLKKYHGFLFSLNYLGLFVSHICVNKGNPLSPRLLPPGQGTTVYLSLGLT